MGTIHVAHTLQAPSLDGDAGDAAWTNAPWTSAFRLLAHPEVEAAGQTRARFVHDGSSLFVCVEAEVPDASTLTLKSTNVHDAPLWKDDCIEIHLDPGATESHFFQIIVNWKGTVYDAYGEDDNKGAGTFSMRPEWDARAETAVRIADGLWTTELKIPFASLRLAPGAKATWGVNVARARFSPKPEFSTWSPLDPTRGFGQPTRYRRMELASFDPAPFWWSCLPPAVQSTWSETQTVCRVEAVLINETGRERQADVVLDFAGERRVARETFAPDAKRKVAFDVPVQKMGRHRLRLRLTDAGDPAATRFDWQVEAEVDDQPLRLELLKPAYRDCLFASQKTPRIEARLHCDPALVGRPITIRLQGDGVQTEPKTFAAAAARQDFAFPMEDHPDGTYEMVVEMPGVKPLVRQIRKLPPLEGEAWLDARGNLHVDGKPFFPFGWYMGPLDREPGMNVVLRYGVPDTNYLDKARVGGKKVIAMPYPFTSDLFKHTKMQGTLTDAQAAEITAVVEQSRHHPALLAYYLVDEPEGTNVSLEWLQAAYKLINTLDPHHPILITNYGLRGIQAYYSACDILMPDCYPPESLAKRGASARNWLRAQFRLPEDPSRDRPCTFFLEKEV